MGTSYRTMTPTTSHRTTTRAASVRRLVFQVRRMAQSLVWSWWFPGQTTGCEILRRAGPPSVPLTGSGTMSWLGTRPLTLSSRGRLRWRAPPHRTIWVALQAWAVGSAAQCGGVAAVAFAAQCGGGVAVATARPYGADRSGTSPSILSSPVRFAALFASGAAGKYRAHRLFPLCPCKGPYRPDTVRGL